MPRRKTSERLAEVLVRDLNPMDRGGVFSITANDLWRHHGPLPYHDDTVGRWGGTGTVTFPNGAELRVHLGSYETMTECAQSGVSWRWRRAPYSSGIDVAPRESPAASED